MTNDVSLTGYAPLDALLRDEAVSMVVMQGVGKTLIRKDGHMQDAALSLDSIEQVQAIAQHIFTRYDPQSQPAMMTTYVDGVHVQLIPQPMPQGLVLHFHKANRGSPFTAEDLVRLGTWTPEVHRFLQVCVRANLNVIVCGGTSSGKTTLLSILANALPPEKHILQMETREPLPIAQPFVTKLRPRRRYQQSGGDITAQALMMSAMYMNPDTVVMDALAGGEAFPFLQGINTGPSGLATVSANSPRSALIRLETLCLMAGMDLPVRAIREQVAVSVDVICHMRRLPDGSRKVLYVTEVLGMEGEMLTLADIFEFEQTGTEVGRVVGSLRVTGLRPRFMGKFEDADIDLPSELLGARGRE